MNTPQADRRRAGFTLIEILVVVTIIAAIISIAVPVLQNAQDAKNVTICKSNLRSIAISIHDYRQRFKRFPKEKSGIQFILAPWKSNDVPHSEKTIRAMYISPGDDYAADNLGDWQEAYGDIENIDPGVISYAGRNSKDYPLSRKNAAEEIIACTAGGPEGREVIHRNKINIAYLDMSVSDIDITQLPNGDPKEFSVGPDSPLEKLQKLNKDP